MIPERGTKRDKTFPFAGVLVSADREFTWCARARARGELLNVINREKLRGARSATLQASEFEDAAREASATTTYRSPIVSDCATEMITVCIHWE